MAAQCIVLMFLFVTVEKLAAKAGSGNYSDFCHYKHLTEPSHCENSSKIEVYKDNTTYSLRLRSNANDNCETPPGMWLLSARCSGVCKACEQLTGGNNSCSTTKDIHVCEEMMDTFLNDYCKSAMADIACITTTIPTTIVSSSQCIATVTTTVPYIETVSVSLPCSQPPTSPPLDQTITCTNTNGKTSSKTAVSRNLTTTNMALGALLGLSVTLLAMVTMGWVCTCIIRKKRNRNIKMSTNSTESDEKYFENPTYDSTSVIGLRGAIGPGVHGVPVLPVAAHKPQANDPGAMHNAVNTSSPKTTGKGQTCHVLGYDRGKGCERSDPANSAWKGKRSTARNVRTPKGYSQLGLPDNDVDNNYHLINEDND